MFPELNAFKSQDSAFENYIATIILTSHETKIQRFSA